MLLSSFFSAIPNDLVDAARLDGCGHMSIMEKPAAVAAAVAQLIERGTAR